MLETSKHGLDFRTALPCQTIVHDVQTTPSLNNPLSYAVTSFVSKKFLQWFSKPGGRRPSRLRRLRQIKVVFNSFVVHF